MKLSKKAAALTAATVVSAALAVGLAGVAGASGRTPGNGGAGGANCANGIYANYCSLHESGTGLYLAAGWNDQIVGVKYPKASDADFFFFADASASAANNDKYAEFAPNGVASNKVMAEVKGHMVLVTATGAADQKWVFDGTGWQNVATGHVLKATFNGGPVLAAPGPSSGAAETWNYVAP
jgi:hypothetical protein